MDDQALEKEKTTSYTASLWCSSPGAAMQLHAFKRRAEFNVKTPKWFSWVIVKKFCFKEASGHISGSALFVPGLLWHPHS